MIKKIEDFETYQLAMELGEQICNIVLTWDYFAKDTVGKQIVRSADSIAANLSEGFGRYHFKEKKNFSYYARGSLYETKTWVKKANNRSLITEDQFKLFRKKMEILGVKINNYINSI